RIPPIHPLAPHTPLPILLIRHRALELATLRAAHARLGPVIQLAPAEISVNCVVGGIREIYGGGWEKGCREGEGWYAFFANYGGTPNMFSTSRNKPHAARKRLLSNIYSKSAITTSPALLAQTSSILYSRFLPSLSSTFDTSPSPSSSSSSSPSSSSDSASPGTLNIIPLLSAATMDIVTAYIFGLASSSNLLRNARELAWFLDLYNSRRSFNFWPQELPRLTAFARKWFGYKFVPDWVGEANGEIEAWTKAMCDGAARVLEQQQKQQGAVAVAVADTPVVYQQLAAGLAKEASKTERSAPQNADADADAAVALASEVLDHLAAGFDTSGITLTYAIHELSQHPTLQSRLQHELATLSPRLTASSAPALPAPKAVDALPLLHAVVWETLRLHSAIPGPQPRWTPPQGCRLGPELQYHVPGGVRVSASAGLLHRNEDVYERAAEWRPERWLERELVRVGAEKRKDMESRWFWAFGSGGRMCVGSHLAVYQMKYLLAALYTNYTTTIVDDTNIAQSDAYTAPPKTEKLLIRL
ncbi:cytochrome P450, partial [Massariosphaeria phaeospora]